MILVTGANGIVGSEICKILFNSNIPFKAMRRSSSNISLLNIDGVDWVEGDVLDSFGLHNLLIDVEVVIHCAAIVSYSKKDEAAMREVNVIGTKNVIDACLNTRVKRLIHISSVAALGREVGKVKIDESSIWTDSEMNSVYAETKYLAELEVWRGHYEGLACSVVNPSVVLAAGDGVRSSSKLLKYVWDEEKFFIDGIVNYVDARDVAQAVQIILANNITGERFVLSAGCVDYKKIFIKIARNFNRRPPSIKVSGILLRVIYLLDQLKYIVTRIEPIVTKEMLKSTKNNFEFVNQKSMNSLSLQYTSLDDTLDWACAEFKHNIKK